MTNETSKPVEPAKDLEAANKPAAPATTPTPEQRKVLERTRGGSYDMKGMG